MYCNSTELLSRIELLSREIHEKSNGKIAFEEYIVLPFYGQIVLRFDLLESSFTLDNLDHYEALIYESVKDEFLIDFMGRIYGKAGINYSRMEKLFADCFDYYANVTLSKAPYAGQIEADARYLLKSCGLAPDLPVWELQLENDVIHLFILKDRSDKLGCFHIGSMTVTVLTADLQACDGLMKAVFFAKQNNISLARALLVVQENT